MSQTGRCRRGGAGAVMSTVGRSSCWTRTMTRKSVVVEEGWEVEVEEEEEERL